MKIDFTVEFYGHKRDSEKYRLYFESWKILQEKKSINTKRMNINQYKNHISICEQLQEETNRLYKEWVNSDEN